MKKTFEKWKLDVMDAVNEACSGLDDCLDERDMRLAWQRNVTATKYAKWFLDDGSRDDRLTQRDLDFIL